MIQNVEINCTLFFVKDFAMKILWSFLFMDRWSQVWERAAFMTTIKEVRVLPNPLRITFSHGSFYAKALDCEERGGEGAQSVVCPFHPYHIEARLNRISSFSTQCVDNLFTINKEWLYMTNLKEFCELLTQ